jgi:hypothetical protein
MRFISAPLSFPAAIFEAMFVPRISYYSHDTREDGGKAARKNTVMASRADGRLLQNGQSLIFVQGALAPSIRIRNQTENFL